MYFYQLDTRRDELVPLALTELAERFIYCIGTALQQVLVNATIRFMFQL